MVFVNTGISGAALAIGSLATNRPKYMSIGEGSEAIGVSRIDLIDEVDRRLVTSTNVATVNEIKFIADWDSLDMSGLDISETGLFTESGLSIGSAWSIEGFAPIIFDGTTELQVQITYQNF